MAETTLHTDPMQVQGRPTRTIRQKIVFLTALLVAAISLFIYLFFPARLEQQAVETIAAKAASIAEMSAYTLAPALDFDNVDEVEEGLQAALQFEDALYAYVQNEKGAFVGSFLKDSSASATLVSLSPDDGIGPNRRVYHVRRAITSNGQMLGYLYMGFSLEPLNASLARSRFVLAMVSLLVFLLGMGAAFVISIFITRPLSEIVQTADRIAQGDLSQRAAVASNDEVGHLATSFNKMIDSLETAYKEQGASQARFRAVIEHATDIIGLIDANGRILYLSPSVEHITGYSPEDLLEKSLFEHVHSDDQAVLRTGLQQGVEDPTMMLTAEVRWRHKNGSWRYLSYRGRSLLNHPGIESILITARDITENKQFEQELVDAKDKAEEMVQLKNAFLANMSHEIRTPLTGILGYAQILTEEVDEEQQELVETITYSGHRLMNTLNSVLDLAQLEAQSIAMVPERLDIAYEVTDAIQILKPLKEEAVTLSIVKPDEPVFADLDPHAFQRILTNLIGTALKFTKKGQVTAVIEKNDTDAVLSIRDTGIGISKTFLPHIFDEFKQESTGMARSHEGNGLGLSITKQLIELMDGTISVDSIKNLGTVFTLTFPAADPPAETPALPLIKAPAADTEAVPSEAAPPPQEPPPAPAEQPTLARAEDRPAQPQEAPRNYVLVVEDNMVTRKMMEHILAPYFEVESTASSSEALEAATRRQFHAVLMDINLGPGKDGIDTMHDLRTQLDYQETPVIAVTAYTMPEDRKRFLEAGFDDYLSKPFKREQLVGLLTRHLLPQNSATC